MRDERPDRVVKYKTLSGLYPLLPLMKGEAGEDPKQVLQQSIEAVKEVGDKSLQQDLLAVMGILAGGRYAAELVYSMIRREMVVESPIYQEWVKGERAEAKVEGKVEVARAALRKGFSVEDVVEITGLSRETVLGLKNELEN